MSVLGIIGMAKRIEDDHDKLLEEYSLRVTPQDKHALSIMPKGLKTKLNQDRNAEIIPQKWGVDTNRKSQRGGEMTWSVKGFKRQGQAYVAQDGQRFMNYLDALKHCKGGKGNGKRERNTSQERRTVQGNRLSDSL